MTERKPYIYELIQGQHSQVLHAIAASSLPFVAGINSPLCGARLRTKIEVCIVDIAPCRVCRRRLDEMRREGRPVRWARQKGGVTP